MSSSLVSTSLLVPSWSIKMEAGREYREAPATSVTLTLPLRSLILNWLNELPIWEVLVTAYWCVHACVRTRVSSFVKSTVTTQFSLWLSALLFSFLSLHFCSATSFSQSTPKFNKLLHRHWSFLTKTFALEKKKKIAARWGAWWDSAVCSFEWWAGAIDSEAWIYRVWQHFNTLALFRMCPINELSPSMVATEETWRPLIWCHCKSLRRRAGQGMRQQLVSYDKEPLCDEIECDPEKYCSPMLNTSLYCE